MRRALPAEGQPPPGPGRGAGVWGGKRCRRGCARSPHCVVGGGRGRAGGGAAATGRSPKRAGEEGSRDPPRVPVAPPRQAPRPGAGEGGRARLHSAVLLTVPRGGVVGGGERGGEGGGGGTATQAVAAAGAAAAAAAAAERD